MSDERHNPGREPEDGPRRERFEDLKEAYALGALSEEERREVEEYLRTYPELRAEVDDLKSVANLLQRRAKQLMECECYGHECLG